MSVLSTLHISTDNLDIDTSQKYSQLSKPTKIFSEKPTPKYVSETIPVQVTHLSNINSIQFNSIHLFQISVIKYMFTNIIYKFRSCLKVNNLKAGNPFTNINRK